MDFVIEYGAEPQDVTITTSGIADVAGFGRLNSVLRSDPRFQADLTILYDLTKLDISRLSEQDIEEITDSITERDWDSLPGAVARIVPSPEAIDPARLAIAHLGGKQSRRRVFTSRDDGIAWLRAQRS